jgi:hypothetical protein
VAASKEFMEENALERAIHPPYSQDVVLSDFYLCSHVKHCLRGHSFETADETLWAIDAVLRGPAKRTLYMTFLDCTQGSRQYVKADCNCFE